MKVSRRRFLQGAGAIAGAAALGTILKTGQVRAAEEFKGNPDRYGMLTDTTKCQGCRLCEYACNKSNKLPTPTVAFTDLRVFRTQRRPEAGTWTVVNSYPNQAQPGGKPIYRKVQCMHCNEPACAAACPVGALQKQTQGMVTYNESVCIGCRYCMTACPFNMPAFEFNNPTTPKVSKCQMCFERVVKQGTIPACAEICPTKATIFGKRSDLLATAKQRIMANPEKYVNHVYGETEAGGTGWLYLAAVPPEQVGLPTNLGTTPMPEYTRDWLLGVPLILTIFPALLMGVRELNKRKKEEDKVGEGPPTEPGKPEEEAKQ